MKLLSKTNRYYLLWTALLMSIGGVIFYFIISNIIREEVGEVLEYELELFVKKAKTEGADFHFENPVEFEMKATEDLAKPDTFSDTVIYEHNNEAIPYLQLKAYREIEGKMYEVILRESLVDSEGILFGVAISMAILFVTLLIGLLIINNILSQRIWQPFYSILNQLRNFRVTSPHAVQSVDTDTQEFEQLNQTLIKMTDRLRKDYLGLKQFTENASHEYQTPLAIIKSNVDQLLQKTTQKDQVQSLDRIESAINRISKTNQALLLLTKIENQSFTELEHESIGLIVEDTLKTYDEFIKTKSLKINVSIKYKGEQLINKPLVQIMISNLIGNAIKHNHKKGFIAIRLDEDRLEISNSGQPLNPEVDPKDLFQRFSKGNPSSDSSGLGLAVIKQICDVLEYEITYQVQDTHHIITIRL